VAQFEALRSLSGMRAWNPPILKAVATTGHGIADVVDAIDAHQAHLRDSVHTNSERRELARRQILALTQAALHRRAREMAEKSQALDALVSDVMQRREDPRSAAERLLEAFWREWVDDRAKQQR
jgi:LAO/AO transport system kinase